MDCIFCKIASGEIPSQVVYEDSYALAFLDINPIAKGHTLVIPKGHFGGISELDDSALLGTVRAIQKIAGAIEKTFSENLNIFVNQGEVAGQVIPHFHAHIVPRREDDGVEFITPKVNLTEEEFEKLRTRLGRNIK